MEDNVDIRIDQLILHGFSSNDGYYIGRAFETELTRLIEEEGLPSHFSNSANLRVIDTEGFEYDPNAQPETIGKQIAASIYSGLTP